VQNDRQLHCARVGVIRQRALHEIGNTFLLKALQRIGHRLKNELVSTSRSGLRRPSAQADAYPFQNPLAAGIIGLRQGLFSSVHGMIPKAVARAHDDGSKPA